MSNDLKNLLSTRISTDTLRYYDDFGLLKPTFTSTQTGYRYYSKEQSIIISWILELKGYGFSLKEIKDILQNSEIKSFELFRKHYLDLLN